MPPLPVPFDEPPQPDSKIEWWFFHGRFGGGEVAERYFMASVFRTRLAEGNGHSADAFKLFDEALAIDKNQAGAVLGEEQVQRTARKALQEVRRPRRLGRKAPPGRFAAGHCPASDTDRPRCSRPSTTAPPPITRRP